MSFNFTITLINAIYNFLNKTKYGNCFNIDKFIDLKYPQTISQIQNYSNYSKIAICATNGKKTTLNFIKQIIINNNQTYYTNLEKINLNPIYISLISQLAKNKEENRDYYLMGLNEFEIDNYFNSLKFDYLILNNLFDDHRYLPDLKEKRKKIQQALKLNPKTNLIINADDAMLFNIDENKKRKKIFFGFNTVDFNTNLAHKNDIIKCPNCGCDLDFEKRFYSHLGYYNCVCGFKRPKLDISANAKIYNNYSLLNVNYQDKNYSFRIPIGGMYNAYNALCAISVALELNIERKIITQTFDNYIPFRGRDEILSHKNRYIKIKLIKNSTSLSEAIREVKNVKNLKILFCLNDKKVDGIDTSWIWDSNFEVLEGFEDKIYTTGTRLDDMALRLKYAGVNPSFICMDTSIKNAIECCFWDLEANETMLILTTQSALEEVYYAIEGIEC